MQKTHLGWVFVGNVPASMLNCNSKLNRINLDDLVQEFWTIEELPKEDILTSEEELVYQIFFLLPSSKASFKIRK